MNIVWKQLSTDNAWPLGYYNGDRSKPAVFVGCETPYNPDFEISGVHAPLSVWMVDYSVNPPATRKVATSYPTMAALKSGVSTVLDEHPQFAPQTGPVVLPEIEDVPEEAIAKEPVKDSSKETPYFKRNKEPGK